jgi:hypothetical protein
MNRPSIAVQHCVLTTLTRQHGSRPVFDLLEVSYEHEVSPDTEFPKVVPKFDLFLRVIADSAGPTRLRVRVYHWRRYGWDRVNEYTPGNRLAFPTHGTLVASFPFRLPNVKLTGTGLYAVVVYLRPARQPWGRGAVEYFQVVR